MTNEITIKYKNESGDRQEKKLYSDKPMTRQILKRAATQVYKNGPWHTYNQAEAIEILTKAGYIMSDTPPAGRKDGWRTDQATDRQVGYLNDLGVRLEAGMTKGRASQLIDAAQNDMVGAIGGWYRDGSN